MMTHKNRMLCGPPDWFYIITYIGNHGKTAELNLIGIDSVQVHTSIAKTIRSSCGFDRVESIIRNGTLGSSSPTASKELEPILKPILIAKGYTK